MCGIIGIVGKDSVNQTIYDGLTVLQHRGQDAAGIMTADKGQLHLRKSNGLVRDVFHTRHMLRLAGNMGIGHVRYPTAGSSSNAESQPFYVNSPYGIALAHNGNLTNAQDLKRDVFRDDLRQHQFRFRDMLTHRQRSRDVRPRGDVAEPLLIVTNARLIRERERCRVRLKRARQIARLFAGEAQVDERALPRGWKRTRPDG